MRADNVNILARTFHTQMGSTGDPPVPSGDSPLGRQGAWEESIIVEHRTRLSISSGQWPDETGRWPVLPRKYEVSGPPGSEYLVRFKLTRFSVIPLQTRFLEGDRTSAGWDKARTEQ